MESNRFVKLYKQGSTLGSSYLEIWLADQHAIPICSDSNHLD